jgi:hypothetical protein
MRVALGVLVLGAACNKLEPSELEDSGLVCLYASDPQGPAVQQFDSDQPVYVLYSSEGMCLSSSCTRDRMASCTVTGGGTALVVASHASWIELEPESGAGCTDDCLILNAVCSTEALVADDYVFTFGANSLALTIPSQHPNPLCFESH